MPFKDPQGRPYPKGTTAGEARKMYRAASKKTVTKIVNNVINRKAESKMAIWYNPAVPTIPSVTPGSYAAAGWNDQNQLITVNVADIHRMIPVVTQGSGPNQRNGDRISPKSLVCRGSVAVNINGPNGTTNDSHDLYAVIYFLQHVTLKNYYNLYANNDFTQLLNTGEDSTAAFQGFQRDKDMPVNSSSYRLLKKKVIPLRWAGVTQTPVPSTGVSSIANSHTYNAQYTVNLTKYLPKTLKYPESTASQGVNDPTNSSIFMCVGWVDMKSVDAANVTPTPVLYLNQTYQSQMTWKDL